MSLKLFLANLSPPLNLKDFKKLPNRQQEEVQKMVYDDSKYGNADMNAGYSEKFTYRAHECKIRFVRFTGAWCGYVKATSPVGPYIQETTFTKDGWFGWDNAHANQITRFNIQPLIKQSSFQRVYVTKAMVIEQVHEVVDDILLCRKCL